MKILFLVLGCLLVVLAMGAVVGYFYMKSYLDRSRKGVESTMSEIAEEIDSYQEKTQ